MDSQIDPKLLRSINATKKQLGKHISKPVLADRHLGRPPFRFLLEIISNVVQQTGFMKDIISPKELKCDDMKNAEDKRVFLKKVVDAIEKETGEECDVRISKILSGKEPEKTNEWLQQLAKAITSFSSKQKETSKEAAATTGGKEEGPTEVATKSKDTEKVEKGQDGKRKSEPIKTKSYAAATTSSVRRSSGSPTTALSKTKPSSGDKSVPVKGKPPSVKTAPTSPSVPTKVASKETLKSKEGSPQGSTTLVPPPKNPPSVHNLNKSRSSSGQSLGAKSSTCLSKTAKLPDPLQKDVETRSKEKTTEQNVECQDKQKIVGISPMSNKAAMPPETTAEVPLQRPVTRTKYRQKTNESDNAQCIGENVSDSQLETEVPDSGTPVLPTTPTTTLPDVEVDAEDGQEVEDSGKRDECFSMLRSGRSSSSEEVTTEHMNQKISEWRSSLTVEPEETLGANNTGWITFEQQTNQQSGVEVENQKSCMNRVFQSEVDCAAMKVDEEEKMEEEKVHHRQRTEIVRENNRNVTQRPVTVLKDNESGDEDDDTFLVQEKIEYERDLALERIQQGALLMSNAGLGSAVSLDMAYLPPEHRGMLVNQIMDTQRELEKISGSWNAGGRGGTLLENELAERDKAAMRELYLTQIEDLKGAIQKMSKCANPLANVIQRSQDDACLMEIEFRKLKQENDRLQRKIDEAKRETSHILYPLTEELAQLDNRIEKVEGAIILAKQRLSLIDAEYAGEFISQLENTPTEDEAREAAQELDPIWQFRGNFPVEDEGDDIPGGSVMKKSLMDVFKRAVGMYDGDPTQHFTTPPSQTMNPKRKENIFGTPGVSGENALRKGFGMMMSTGAAPPPGGGERRLLNRTVFGEDSLMGRRTSWNSLEHARPPISKENKPSWWD